MTTLLLALVLQFQTAVPADSVDAIRRAARRAEERFERLSRQLAPLQWGGSSSGGQCDEIVGRFCLTYDSGRPVAPGPEAARVTDARRNAIEALRHAFSFEAHRLETAGPLVRYLVEDDRSAEAISAARTYAVLSGDSIWGPLLLGFALHAAANDSAAERLFDEGLARLPAEDRRRIENIEWILSPDDRSAYKRMDPASRAQAEARLWNHSDALFLTPGSEIRVEHISRRVWSRVLAMTPVVTDMVRWGEDLEQLTVRYGVPTARTRTSGTLHREGSLVEHYDPAQLAYVQADLLADGPTPTPLPGETWRLEEPRSRSGYAPRTIRRLLALDHQVTRFPAGDSVVLRVDGEFVLDSVATGHRRVVTGLWVLDAGTFVKLSEVRGEAVADRDTTRFALEVRAGAGARLYSLEALEPETQFGARARYVIDIDPLTDALAVSDPLIAKPFTENALPRHRQDAELQPLGSLVLESGSRVGLYAEAYGLQRDARGERLYRVELSIRRADRAAFPARALSWIGRTLGLSSESVPPRVAWNGRLDGRDPAVLAVNFGLEDLPGGLHAITLTMTDLVTGATAKSTKVIRVTKS
jgi:hypothetical protein